MAGFLQDQRYLAVMEFADTGCGTFLLVPEAGFREAVARDWGLGRRMNIDGNRTWAR
jgi:hypothetical protein